MKEELAVLQAYSLRDLIAQVNQKNQGENKILKEDIVEILNIDGTFFLLYYK